MAPEAFGSVTAIEDSTYDTKVRSSYVYLDLGR